MKVISIPSNVPTSVIKEAIKLYEFNGQFVVTLKWDKKIHGDADKVAEKNMVSVIHKGSNITFAGDKDSIAEIVKMFDDGATDFIRNGDTEGLLKHYGVRKGFAPDPIGTDVKSGELVHA